MSAVSLPLAILGVDRCTLISLSLSLVHTSRRETELGPVIVPRQSGCLSRQLESPVHFIVLCLLRSEPVFVLSPVYLCLTCQYCL